MTIAPEWAVFSSIDAVCRPPVPRDPIADAGTLSKACKWHGMLNDVARRG